MNTHTQGGWSRNIPPVSHYPIVFAGRNTHVAQIITRGLPPEQAEANANLIAAAPDLLAACLAYQQCRNHSRGDFVAVDKLMVDALCKVNPAG